jgi:hypothetical protein
MLAVPTYSEPFAYKAIGKLIEHLKQFGSNYGTEDDVS